MEREGYKDGRSAGGRERENKVKVERSSAIKTIQTGLNMSSFCGKFASCSISHRNEANFVNSALNIGFFEQRVSFFFLFQNF
jgi:hypothetical protein